MQFDDNMHFVSRCPFCSAEYDLDGAKVIGEEDEATVVYVTCSKCESSIVAMVAMTGLGIVSLGLVTDMTEEDTKKFFSNKSVSSDDILHIYETLKEDKNAVQSLKKHGSVVK
ncbi:MAG: hypothetical protein HYR90_01340 [Candidatus Andersenbacteria bacterium]|nr:hypothetical protein [Candidatus Andersenbacteria bacterium]MBI3250510.1 hypothetical protein [Candidatus Andersenbacteria bacterium]